MHPMGFPASLREIIMPEQSKPEGTEKGNQTMKGMTKEMCVDAIVDAITVDLSSDEIMAIRNIVNQFECDYGRAILTASTKSFSEIIERAIAEVKE